MKNYYIKKIYFSISPAAQKPYDELWNYQNHYIFNVYAIRYYKVNFYFGSSNSK